MENLQAQLLNQMWNEEQPANENFEIDMDEDDDRDGDGTLDGGVAAGGSNDDGANRKTKSTECELILFFVCDEALDIAPDHPVLRPGVVVSIGLEKSTKLSAVFQRYIEFCNETSKSKAMKLSSSDVEFVHCHLLNGGDTVEASALMKNDRIKVRKIRTAEREAESDRKRMQRDADRNFFQQIKHLMPDLGGSKSADIILDCQGKVLDESGRNQQVLSSTVKAHSALIKNRCPWLAKIIKDARMQAAEDQRLEASNEKKQEQIPEEQRAHLVRRIESDAKSADEDEDDDIAVLSFSPGRNDGEEEKETTAVAEIENDEEDEEFSEAVPQKLSYLSRAGFPAIVPPEKQSSQDRRLLRVIIQDHSPEAVKLLLEYCYSNRVASLGQEAFVHACKTKPTKHSGPVAPFPISSGSRRWPKNGFPTVPFPVTMAGIVLAEEAGLPRLSLMCEVAASLLVTPSNVMEALSLCTSQARVSGNDLPRLRKAAMGVILGSGSRGVSELGRSQSFCRALNDRRAIIVPTLLQGMTEAVSAQEKKRGFKRDRKDTVNLFFQDLDSDDKYRRDRERKRRKMEHSHSDPSRQHEFADFERYYEECRDSSSRSLKRMAKHLESMPSRALDLLTSRSRYTDPNATRRSSGNRWRRRSSGHQF